MLFDVPPLSADKIHFIRERLQVILSALPANETRASVIRHNVLQIDGMLPRPPADDYKGATTRGMRARFGLQNMDSGKVIEVKVMTPQQAGKLNVRLRNDDSRDHWVREEWLHLSDDRQLQRSIEPDNAAKPVDTYQDPVCGDPQEKSQ